MDSDLVRYVNMAVTMLGRKEKKYLLFYKYRLSHPYHSKLKLYSFLLCCFIILCFKSSMALGYLAVPERMQPAM